MSYASNGLYEDDLVFTGQCGITKATVIKGKKWKKFGLNKEDGRYLTGHTKVSEFVWCKAFCLCLGYSTTELAETIENLIEDSYTQSAACTRINKIKRYYLWVCLAYLKDAGKTGRGGNYYNPYWNAIREVKRWIEYLHSLVEEPACKTCHDSGLKLIDTEHLGWDYCTCKKGKLRRKSLFNE
jgi:hypothetical protein